jgi:hypothetical protein
MRRPQLSISQILAYADAFHRRTGRWPSRDSGRIVGALGESWQAINVALSHGHRGLPGGSSLALLLHQWRGLRHKRRLPRLSIKKILAWADAHFQCTGTWPHHDSGAIAEAPGETWLAVAKALIAGSRGLAGGTTLARLLAKHRGCATISTCRI